MNKSDLRKQLRLQRKHIPPYKKMHAASQLAQHLSACGIFCKRAKIAFYLANDGEIDPRCGIEVARKSGVHIFLPAIEVDRGLSFRKFGLFAPLKVNKFGIEEVHSQAIPAQELDAILLPLVAFDRRGNRLGMGGGYYDRELANLRHKKRRPLFIGLAYSQQELALIKHDSWDVSLDLVVTERELIVC